MKKGKEIKRRGGETGEGDELVEGKEEGKEMRAPGQLQRDIQVYVTNNCTFFSFTVFSILSPDSF